MQTLRLLIVLLVIWGSEFSFAQAEPAVSPPPVPATTETPVPSAVVAPPPAPAPAPLLNITPDKFLWSGDLRYRLNKGHESIDEDRSWQQLRVRLGLRAEVNEQVKAVIRLATASSSISANQTLGDANDPGMARRSFGLDLAYLDWQPISSGKLWAGRTANPFWAPAKTQLIFDADLAFEGVALKFEPKWGHSSIFANAAGFIISENYAAPQDVVDTGLVGGDVGYAYKRETYSAIAHAGTYHYLNMQNKAITSFDKGAKVDEYSYPYDSYRGNSVYPNDPLLPADQRKYYFKNKYILFELGAEWIQKFGAFEYSAFGDWVQNSAIGHGNEGYEYGAGVKWKGVWFSAAKVNKAADSVVAAFTDSDSNGGGTDNRGERFQLGVQLGKNAQIVLTKFSAQRGVDTVRRKFTLTQLDFSIAF